MCVCADQMLSEDGKQYELEIKLWDKRHDKTKNIISILYVYRPLMKNTTAIVPHAGNMTTRSVLELVCYNTICVMGLIDSFIIKKV